MEFAAPTLVGAAGAAIQKAGLKATPITAENAAAIMDFQRGGKPKLPDEELDFAVLLGRSEGLFDAMYSSLADHSVIWYGTTRSLLWEFVPQPRLVRLLLADSQLDPNAGLELPDGTLQSPLHRCVAQQLLPTAALLLAHPAVDVNKAAVLGGQPDVPLMRAVELSSLDLVRALLRHPAIDPLASVVLRSSKRIETPLLRAVDRNDAACVQLLLNHPQVQLSDVQHPKRARNLAAYLLAQQKASVQIVDLLKAAYAVRWSPQTHRTLPRLLQSRIRTLLLALHRCGLRLKRKNVMQVCSYVPHDAVVGAAPEPTVHVHYFFHPPPHRAVFLKAIGKAEARPTLAQLRALAASHGRVRHVVLAQPPRAELSAHAFVVFDSVAEATAFVNKVRRRDLPLPPAVKDLYATFKAALDVSLPFRFTYLKGDDGAELPENEIPPELREQREEEPPRFLGFSNADLSVLAPTLCLDGLGTWTSDKEVYDLCSPFGSVMEIRFAENPASGRSLGCAFVTMGSREQAARVAAKLHLRQVAGRAVVAGFLDSLNDMLYPVADDVAIVYLPNGNGVRLRAGGVREEFHPSTIEVPTEMQLSDMAPNGTRIPRHRPQPAATAAAAGRNLRPDDGCSRCGAAGHLSAQCPTAGKRKYDGAAPEGRDSGRQPG
eukprot:EG_transcript_3976